MAGLDVGCFHGPTPYPLPRRWRQYWRSPAVGLAFLPFRAVVANRFFSTAVRIQADRGHKVITSGPYRFVRHPGYAAFLVVFIVGGPALGSWLAALVGLFQVPLFLRRTAGEDRVLIGQLDGYADYAGRVCYRLIPGARQLAELCSAQKAYE